MTVSIVANAWETEHFKRRIFRVNIDKAVNRSELTEAIAVAPQHDVLEIVLTDDDMAAVAVAIDCGFSVVDQFDHYAKYLNDEEVSRHVRYARGWLKYVRRAVPTDILELRLLVQIIQFTSRFCRYPFSSGEGIEYYGLRVEKAVYGLFDDLCLVLAPPMRLAGFISLRFTGTDECDWTLMGVNRQFRGVGGAQALLVAAEQLCLHKGRQRVTMKALSHNRRIIRLFTEEFGFERIGASCYLYRLAGHPHNSRLGPVP